MVCIPLSHNVSIDLPFELVQGTLENSRKVPRSAKKTDSLPPGGILKTADGTRVALSSEDFDVILKALIEMRSSLEEWACLHEQPEVTSLIDRIEGKA